MAESFTYSTLPTCSIRLITVNPITDHGIRLNLKIQDFPLDEAPPFHALSYTWGTVLEFEGIICNGKHMRIRHNLADALHTLYGPHHQLQGPIWVDAICINQADDVEKAIQVRRMGEIYSKAQRVIVWLGPSADDSDRAMEFTLRLAGILPSIAQASDIVSPVEHTLPESDDPVWTAVGHLYTRSWFGRLWTFQEAVLANDVLVVCGNKSLGWDVFALVAKDVNRLGLRALCIGSRVISVHSDGFMAMSVMNNARRAMRERRALEFPNLLWIADTKHAMDARDKVYGMLGLASESLRARIPISYAGDGDNDFVRLWVDCARACMEESQYTLLQLIAGRPGAAGLPSWCPNLSATQENLFRLGHHLSAGLPANKARIAIMKVHSNRDLLLITGFRIDTVAEIVERGSDLDGPLLMLDPRKFLDWESRCLQLARTTYSAPSDVVPTGHLFTITCNTRRRIVKDQDDALLIAYHKVLDNIRCLSQNKEMLVPPQEHIKPYYDTWHQISRSCSGRQYFSTPGGHVGLGPPELKRGDMVCAFYGAGPVFFMRPRGKHETDGWSFVGDGFLHGFMELRDTPTEMRGEDETFVVY